MKVISSQTIALAVIPFFPYLNPQSSFRVDQLAIFFIPIVFILMLSGRNYRNTKRFLYSLIVYVLLVGYFMFTAQNLRDFLQLSMQYSYFCSGFALTMLFWKSMERSSDYINIVSWVTIIIGMYSFFQFLMPKSPIVEFMAKYYSGNIDGQISKVQISLSNNRASSIFVQPSSAGLYFLITTSYFISIWRASRRRLHFLVILISVLAGALSGTKVYIFGLPIFLTVYLMLKIDKFYVLKILGMAIALVTVIYVGSWYLPHVGKIIDWLFKYGVVYFILERYSSSNGYLAQSIEAIAQSPYFGYGALAKNFVYADSMPVMLLLSGGCLFLCLFYVLYISFFSSTVRQMKRTKMSLGVALIAASIGFPVFIQARIILVLVLLDEAAKYYINSLSRGNEN